MDDAILVLGAGVAGLGAARALSRPGRRVTVVEARRRTGGRVLTVRDRRAPMPVELGAQFVHGQPARLLRLADAIGLRLCAVEDSHGLALPGRVQRDGRLWEGLRRFVAHARTRPGARVGPLLDGWGDPEEARLIRRFVEGFHAADPDAFPVTALDVEDEDTMGFDVLDGYDHLVRWLEHGLDPDRDRLLLDTAVSAVRWRPGHVEVEVQCGRTGEARTLEGRAAVVTFPVAVLQAGIPRFEPPLPEKEEALKGLASGAAVRLVLSFRRDPWEGLPRFVHADPPFVAWWGTRPVRSPVLTAWTGGPAARSLAGLDRDALVERALAQLASFTGQPRDRLAGELVGAWHHDWTTDPWSRGAYAHFTRGDGDDARALGRPVEGTLFFAGEATEPDWIGTVHGALDSGERVAREIEQG